MSAVVAIQGGHVVEHVIQVFQVFAFGVPEDDALGLLGYVLQFNGTEEWLHLGYNTFYLIALYALILPLWRITPALYRPGCSGSSSSACGSSPGTWSSTA